MVSSRRGSSRRPRAARIGFCATCFAPFLRSASTDGGQLVNISGSDFSFGRFLERVTYGPNGDDYIAADCVYAVPHFVISCLTIPGTGRVLRWLVTVDGQVSALSSVASSYQLPTIISVTPTVYVSSGGGQATLVATGLALQAPAASQTIYLETCYENANYPQQSDIDAYWSAVQAGAAPSASLVAAVQPWIAALTTPMITNVLQASGGLEFTIPPGLPGCGGSFWVSVSGIPSSVWTFNYASPTITNAGELSVVRQETHRCSYPPPTLSPVLPKPRTGVASPLARSASSSTGRPSAGTRAVAR